jgi:hypothetical protein
MSHKPYGAHHLVTATLGQPPNQLDQNFLIIFTKYIAILGSHAWA